MLNDAGGHAFVLFLMLDPVGVEVPDNDNLGPDHLAPDSRYAQAALFKAPVIARFFNDFGVNEYFLEPN